MNIFGQVYWEISNVYIIYKFILSTFRRKTGIKIALKLKDID